MGKEKIYYSTHPKPQWHMFTDSVNMFADPDLIHVSGSLDFQSSWTGHFPLAQQKDTPSGPNYLRHGFSTLVDW